MMKPYDDQINRLHRQEQEQQAARFRLAQISAAGQKSRTMRPLLGGLWARLIVSGRNLRRPVSRQAAHLMTSTRR